MGLTRGVRQQRRDTVLRKPATKTAPSRKGQAAPRAASAKTAEKSLAKAEGGDLVSINRAPVLTLWMAVCLEQLGHSRETALSAAKVIAGRCAVSKGRALGMIPAKEAGAARKRPAVALAATKRVTIAGHVVLTRGTDKGLLALADGSDAGVVDHTKVLQYLTSAFKGRLDDVSSAMRAAAQSCGSSTLRKDAMAVYERFRPAWRGWGVPGQMRLSAIRAAV